MIVEYGELDIEKLDQAVIYKSTSGEVHAVRDRRYCPLCSGTIAFVNMAGGLFATFNQAHLPCVRKDYDATRESQCST